MATFSNNDNAIMLAVIVVILEQSANVFDVDFVLGDKDDVGATRNSCGIGDPPGIAAHDFDDNDAVMGVGGSVDAVDGFGSDGNGRVVAKGLVGAADVVVDGLGNADRGNTVF